MPSAAAMAWREIFRFSNAVIEDRKKAPAIKPGLRFSTRNGFVELRAQDEVGGFLRLRCCLHNQFLVVLKLLKPVLNVGGGILNDVFRDAGLTAKERRAHFGNQFLPAIWV